MDVGALSERRFLANRGTRLEYFTIGWNSIPGIILAIASLIVMPLVSRSKRRVGTYLHSAAMHADARQTEFCAYLSAILLVGLLLNATLGLWWADPVAALVMVPIILREGMNGLRSRLCNCG